MYLSIHQSITMNFDKMPPEDERIYDALEKNEDPAFKREVFLK